MKWPTRVISLAYLICLGALSMAADRFHMDITPVFKGVDSRGASTIALRVLVENAGAGTRGVVQMRNNSYVMRYPIDLPSGAKKTFLAYAPYSYDTTTFTLDTPEGSIDRLYMTTGYSAGGYVGMVSDVEGLLSSVRKRTIETGSYGSKELRDVYAKPGELPDRGAGFEVLRALFLGDGSERLTDIEVRAIQEYVLRGGTLVISGGASAPILKDPRWQPLLPVRNCIARTVDTVSFKVDGTVLSLPGPVTVMAGTPAEDTQVLSGNDFPVLAKRAFGDGRVFFIAISPFESPGNRWADMGQVLGSLVPTVGGDPTTNLRSMAGWYTESSYSYYSRGAPRTTSQSAHNPFNVQMPEFRTVLGVLVLYFILIVPVNLLVLRKMGRGEWAWITSPLISLVFAGVFFRFASSLYSAERAQSSTALIVADEQSPFAVAFGNSQLYFPKGGSYDLGMKGVTLVAGEPVYDYSGFTRSSTNVFDTLNPIDTGEISLPAVQAGNLSFYQFSFEQRVPIGKTVVSELTKSADGTLKGSVQNIGQKPLKEAVLWYKRRPYSVGDLKPGEKKDISAPGAAALDSDTDRPGLSAGTVSQALLLEARLSNAGVGPLGGKDMSEADAKILIFLHSPVVRS